MEARRARSRSLDASFSLSLSLSPSLSLSLAEPRVPPPPTPTPTPTPAPAPAHTSAPVLYTLSKTRNNLSCLRKWLDTSPLSRPPSERRLAADSIFVSDSNHAADKVQGLGLVLVLALHCQPGQRGAQPL